MTPDTRTLKGQSYCSQRWANPAWPKGSKSRGFSIELDLYNEIKKIGQVDESVSCLDTIVQSGYAYEQHCLQMSLPATVKGFVDYLAVMDPVGKGNANGIQLHTYHSSKGLEWKYVILTQLYEKKNDPKKCVKQDIYGIHFSYSEQPSASTPYPEVFIRVIPFIYGAGNTNVPADIQQQIEESSLYKEVLLRIHWLKPTACCMLV